jgi:hypothetical protein
MPRILLEVTSREEVGLRTMAKEDRFSRRLLAADYVDFLERSNEIESRMTVSPSGVAYVFLAKPYGTDREHRRAELGNRLRRAKQE